MLFRIDPDDVLRFRFQLDRQNTRFVVVQVVGRSGRVGVGRIGLAPGPAIAYVIPFIKPGGGNRCYWPDSASEERAWTIIKRILELPNQAKVFQNGLYDIAFLYRAYGIKVVNAQHDTMLLHHSLQPEALKGLGYLGSIYTNERAWKHMRERNTTIKADA